MFLPWQFVDQPGPALLRPAKGDSSRNWCGFPAPPATALRHCTHTMNLFVSPC